LAWIKVIMQNRHTIFRLCSESYAEYRTSRRKKRVQTSLSVPDEQVMQLSEPE